MCKSFPLFLTFFFNPSFFCVFISSPFIFNMPIATNVVTTGQATGKTGPMRFRPSPSNNMVNRFSGKGKSISAHPNHVSGKNVIRNHSIGKNSIGKKSVANRANGMNKRKVSKKTKMLRSIRIAQRGTELFVAKAHIRRLVNWCCAQLYKHDVRVTPDALNILSEAYQAETIKRLQSCHDATIHRSRVILKVQDIHLAKKLQEWK